MVCLAGIKETFLDYPDNESLSIIVFTQGCSHGCKGCHNFELQKRDESYAISYSNFLNRILDFCKRSNTNKVVFSGGDPLYHTSNDNTQMLDIIKAVDFLEKTIGKIPETISCRYNPGGTFSIANDIMDNPGDSKYGMTGDQMIEAFRTLKAHGVKKFGIHAFLASNTVTDDYYPTLAAQLFELAVELKKKCQVEIDFIKLSYHFVVNHLILTQFLLIN